MKLKIPPPYGTEFNIKYQLKKTGATKNELVANSLNEILEYLAKAYKIDKEKIEIEEDA